MEETVDDVLAHYGVKGMRWGVRKRSGDSGPVEKTPVVVKVKPGAGFRVSGGKGQPVSEDAIKAAIARQKAKESGPHALSNQEMKLLVDRMNLEAQYTKLNPATASKGREYMGNVLGGTPARVAVDFAKFGMRNNQDPKVQAGLFIADTIVKNAKKK